MFHSTFVFITFGVQAADRAPPAANQALQTMLTQFVLVFEPLGMLLVGVMAVVLGLIFVAIAFRETHYPRWFAVANPFVIQAVTGAIAFAAPDTPCRYRIQFLATGVLRDLNGVTVESAATPPLEPSKQDDVTVSILPLISPR
ncbi:hypothetical protein SAMN04487948_1175 [Halogranum amylolyticum]|uniref:Uncharacterized protein n=2 Tax=Halogranum amylolyticum TaxID=660520 RepID=A0A1H8VJU8_9EURY|nr:hypothetical protein [Halogranum amylolyticum]SEP15158.1 hypothetical protein SAMN04487948_1175 [Halogranum amylolyticum]